MKKILLLLLLLVPFAYAQEECLEEICSLSTLAVWSTEGCEAMICSGQAGDASGCYQTLCTTDVSSLSSSCGGSICSGVSSGGDSTDSRGVTEADLNALSSQINTLSNQLSGLRNELTTNKNRITSLETAPVQELTAPAPNFSIIYILITVVTIGMLGFSTLNMVKIGKLKKPKMSPSEKQQINNYINSYINQGYKFEQIKGQLLKRWTSEQVKEAYGKV
jgi:hypothetical protein